MQQRFPWQPTAKAVAAKSCFGAEDAWLDPAVIAAATGDLLARLNFFHADDEIDRDADLARRIAESAA
jgi:hypothetical protein